jgi:FtsH-binding integral membrane protein
MERAYERSRADFVSKVMTHMGIGLLITFAVAYFTATNDTLLSMIFSSGFNLLLLMIAEIGLVMYLSRRIDRLSFAAARAGFYVYAALNGLTLSAIFLAYELPTIYSAFITASVMFLAAGFIGITVKKDLSGFGQFLMLMIIGILAASVINIFMRSDSMSYMISILGVFVFSGLTAYDMQMVKNIHYNVYNFDEEVAGKYSIIGALRLYLDFINLFLYILRLLGRKK